MEIYHTETQEDYDALMVELKEQGIETLPKELWKNHRCETAVFVHAIDKNHNSSRNGTTYGNVTWAIYKHPNTPIIKYKAKADEKMKFTKENVLNLTDKWIENKAKVISFQDLQNQIEELDDTPEKIVVPKCFDEWFKEIEAEYQRPDSAKLFAMWKLCQKGFGHSFERANNEKIHFESELGVWLNKNRFLAIDAVLNGYTIEPEQLYYITLPDLETSDGKQQVLSKRENDENYFASRPNKNLKQRFTKDEIEQVPEIYKPFAKLIEEEGE